MLQYDLNQRQDLREVAETLRELVHRVRRTSRRVHFQDGSYAACRGIKMNTSKSYKRGCQLWRWVYQFIRDCTTIIALCVSSQHINCRLPTEVQEERQHGGQITVGSFTRMYGHVYLLDHLGVQRITA